MKKTNLVIWTIIIIATVYAIFQISGDFDINKVNSPIKDTFLSASSTNLVPSATSMTIIASTSFAFDGVLYPKDNLLNGFKKIKVGKIEFFAKIVDDEVSRVRGLSGNSGMSDEVGMLFVFDTTASHGFWMKDMKFPIDIIWIDEKMKIIDISRQVLPESYPEVIMPISPIRFVLEINAGIASSTGLKRGDLITF